MNEQERLTELQRQIAAAQGYTDLRLGHGVYSGVLHADEGHTLVPRWPWDIDAAWRLVEEMKQAPGYDGYQLDAFPQDSRINPDKQARFHLYLKDAPSRQGEGRREPEAICVCWLAWRAARQP